MNLPLKWHGGKYYLASKIVGLMPAHLYDVEPFFGGGAVLFARKYDTTLKSWTRHTFELPSNAAGGETKRRMTEVLWCNF